MSQPLNPDHLEDRLCLALHRASHAMTAAYRKVLEPLGLTYPQYTVLSALWLSDPATVKDLGEVLGSDYNTMSPLIKRLEAKTLVRRTRSNTDEREVLVHLTAAGHQLHARAETVQTNIHRASGLSDARRQRLVNDLHQLSQRLHALNDQPTD